MKQLTVAELVSFLLTQDQRLSVAYQRYSEHCLLETSGIEVKILAVPREDGWVHDRWAGYPNQETQQYLVFPGN